MAARFILVVTASLTLAACGRAGAYYDSDRAQRYGPPIFSWDALPSCEVPPPSTEAAQPASIQVGSTQLQVGVPEGWAQDSPSAAAANEEPRSWHDPANEAWLGVGQLELDSPTPARDARLYISDRYLHADGDTIVQICGHCIEIKHRCRATIGGRTALVTEGGYMGRTVQVMALFPQSHDLWLAVAAGALDSLALPSLRARVRRVEFD